MLRYTEVMPGIFMEEGFDPKPKRLSDEAYADAVGAFSYHCCDVIPYQLLQDKLFICLANRCTDPARDEWWVYGGRLGMGEPLIKAAIRHFQADTGLEIAESRLTRLFGEPQRYLWAKGPKDTDGREVSMDVFADTFAFAITDDEIDTAWVNLRESEYYGCRGIRLFDRSKLVEIDAHPAMLRIYDEIDRTFVGRP